MTAEVMPLPHGLAAVIYTRTPTPTNADAPAFRCAGGRPPCTASDLLAAAAEPCDACYAARRGVAS